MKDRQEGRQATSKWEGIGEVMKRERERERGLEVDVNKSIFNSEINEVNILNERCKSVMLADDIPNVSDRPVVRASVLKKSNYRKKERRNTTREAGSSSSSSSRCASYFINFTQVRSDTF